MRRRPSLNTLCAAATLGLLASYPVHLLMELLL